MAASFTSRLTALAQFNPDKMGKVTVAQGETLFAGLNCFEPGQHHTAHAHAGQDKLYVVLEGEAEIQVGDERQLLSSGGAAFAPSGVLHAIRNYGEKRLIVMTVLAPPPSK
jgi:quercetin dioxygenase-like cupin family protein